MIRNLRRALWLISRHSCLRADGRSRTRYPTRTVAACAAWGAQVRTSHLHIYYQCHFHCGKWHICPAFHRWGA